jgi:hypothetical protein
MTLFGRDLLLVGQNIHGASALTHRLRGWGFHRNLRAASDTRVSKGLLNGVNPPVLNVLRGKG